MNSASDVLLSSPPLWNYVGHFNVYYNGIVGIHEWNRTHSCALFYIIVVNTMRLWNDFFTEFNVKSISD